MSLCRCLSEHVSYCGHATEGGIPRSPLPVIPVPRGQRRQRKGRTVRGAKGTFQGEQRPRRSIPPTTTLWRLR